MTPIQNHRYSDTYREHKEMNLIEQTERLQAIPLFSKLDSAQLKLLAFTCEVFEYSAEEPLFVQDSTGDAVYVILEGEIEIRRIHEQAEMVVGTKRAGQTIGEMAVLRGARRSATVVALDKVKALKIPGERFLSLIANNSDLALFVLKDLSTRLEETTQALTLAIQQVP